MEDFFARQRGAEQAVVQRVQRRAGRDAVEEPDAAVDPALTEGGAGDRGGSCGAAKWAADAAALDKERNSKLGDLEMLLDGGGRIARPDFAGARLCSLDILPGLLPIPQQIQPLVCVMAKRIVQLQVAGRCMARILGAGICSRLCLGKPVCAAQARSSC